jgi:hypothetical protein
MAKYNSIALGTASGKIGNLIFQAYNKMKIVRSKNTTTSNLNSPARLNVKWKFRNLTSMWLTFGEFFQKFTLSRKFQESNYNLFIRKFYEIMTAQQFATQEIIYNNVQSYSEDNSSDFLWIEVTRNENPDSTFLFLFEFYPYFETFRSDMRIRAIILDNTCTFRQIIDRPLTETDFNNHYFEIITDDSANYERCIAYIYFVNRPECSDIKFYDPNL